MLYPKLKEILAYNNLRFGDILQTVGPLTILQERYPDLSITYLIDKRFQAIETLVPQIKFVGLPLYEWTGLFQQNQTEAYHQLETAIKDDLDPTQKLFINFAHSRAGSLLSNLSQCQHTWGLSLSDTGKQVIGNAWFRYLFTGALCRRLNPFNLIDTYLNIAGLNGEDFFQHREHFIKSQPYALKKGKYIAMQLGSSKAHKQWPAAYYGLLARKLRQNDYQIVLLGTNSERPFLEEFKKGYGEDLTGIIDLMGKTSLNELAGVLKQVQLLITNDTGTMHVAALCNTPMVVLDLGPIFYTETAPYSEDVLVVTPTMSCYPCEFHDSCSHTSCKTSIHPQELYHITLEYLNNRNQFQEYQSRNLSCWKTFLNKEDKMLDFKSLTVYRDEDYEVRTAYRKIWTALLSGGKKLSIDALPDTLQEFFNLLKLATTRKNQYYMEALENLIEQKNSLKPIFWYLRFEKEREIHYNLIEESNPEALSNSNKDTLTKFLNILVKK